MITVRWDRAFLHVDLTFSTCQRATSGVLPHSPSPSPPQSTAQATTECINAGGTQASAGSIIAADCAHTRFSSRQEACSGPAMQVLRAATSSSTTLARCSYISSRSEATCSGKSDMWLRRCDTATPIQLSLSACRPCLTHQVQFK